LKVFVYGTLRKGERNAYHLNDATYLHGNAWAEGTLYDTGHGYPVMFLNHSHNASDIVYGEVYDIDMDILGSIDKLEGYIPGRTNNLYERVKARVYTDDGVLDDVITYVAGETLQHSEDIIPLGDWKVYTYLQKSELLYFAYGSCMDDERFKQAHVDQYFKDILGRGVLNGYHMQFSRSTTDGGKADIAESINAITEGVIYRIPIEAVDYLYKREGVHTKGYRPSVVTVSCAENPYDVLTFIGLDKQPETPPTNLYATEFIRGATGILSEDYMEQGKDKIKKLMARSR